MSESLQLTNQPLGVRLTGSSPVEVILAELLVGHPELKEGAVVAVARKLSVLLHRLWVTGEVYDPLHNTHRRQGREEAAKERDDGAQPGMEEVKVAP